MRNLALCLLLLGCGPDAPGRTPDGSVWNGDSGPDEGTLRVEPANAEVTVSGGVAAEIDYMAILRHADGSEEDISDEASFTLLNPTLGTFAGAHFTSATAAGGHTRVRASARGLYGETDLTVRLETVVIGPGADGGSPGKFTGPADPTRNPTLVYPNDGILVPPNLNELEFHFLAGPGNTLFEVRFLGSAVDLRVYLGCQAVGTGCYYLPDEATWLLMSDAERGQDPVKYTVRGVDGASPGGVGSSAEQEIGFAEEDMTGGLYYWNAGAGAIRRYDFGRRGQTAENYIDAARAGAMTCVGCHVISRAGDKIATGLDIPAPSPYKVWDVATRNLIYQQGTTFGGGANFFSFSPDSSQIMTSDGANIAWRDSSSGAAILDPLVTGGAMPDWSPDGTTLVYAKPSMAPPCFPGFPCGAPGVDAASLESLTYDGSSWSPGAQIVAFAGQNNYYPTFSPDGNWVIFNRSPGNVNSFDAPDAQVFVVNKTAGTPIHMAAASTGGDSWPKWAQIVQMHQGRALMWFTFSSRRAVGLRKPAGDPSQIWMAAFDPDRAELVTDPSYPAFWLPFQEPASGNHIAQWTLEVERQPCTTDGECDTGEFCEDGICVPQIE